MKHHTHKRRFRAIISIIMLISITTSALFTSPEPIRAANLHRMTEYLLSYTTDRSMFTLEVGCDDFYFGDWLAMKEYSYDYDAVTGEVSNESVKIYNTITELTDICYESSDESI